MKEDYRDAVRIVPEALEEEFVRLPADLARWNELYAEASGAVMDAKAKVERVYAKLFVKLKNGGGDDDDEDAPRSRLTEGMIKARIELDVGYQAARAELSNATREKLRLYGIVDAIRAKRDSLISIGAQQRAELHPPKIRDRAHNADDEDEDD